MGKVTIIYANGTIDSAPMDKLNLGKLQQMVGGYIERVPHFSEYEGEKCIALCDEEGKLKGKQFNLQATKLWYDQPKMIAFGEARFKDQLVGDILILQGADLLSKF